MQFWSVNVDPKYLNFVTFFKGFISYPYIVTLPCSLVTRHEHVLSFLRVYFQTNSLASIQWLNLDSALIRSNWNLSFCFRLFFFRTQKFLNLHLMSGILFISLSVTVLHSSKSYAHVRFPIRFVIFVALDLIVKWDRKL
jgi:hypothetical protein